MFSVSSATILPEQSRRQIRQALARQQRRERELAILDRAVAAAATYFSDLDTPPAASQETARAVLAHLVFWHRRYVDTAQALADGRIFTGRQAKEAKLVDELGNLEDAIELAADLAGIEGEPKVVEPRRRFSIREFIESRLSRLFPKLDFYSGVSLKYLMAY